MRRTDSATMCKAVETGLLSILGAEYWDDVWRSTEVMKGIEVDVGSETCILGKRMVRD